MARVVHNPDLSRYEIQVDGSVVGFTQYRERAGAIDFVHTEVDDAYEGHGLAGQLARGALDDVRSQGRKVMATCPFIKGWIEKHEDYQDLLAA
ncbi:MAG: GNAT family N-acetyltransferase [Acidimicrobiales bacterium]